MSKDGPPSFLIKIVEVGSIRVTSWDNGDFIKTVFLVALGEALHCCLQINRSALE
jgi:hypothetical protein